MVKSNACKGSWEGWKADFLWFDLIFFFSEATSPPAEVTPKGLFWKKNSSVYFMRTIKVDIFGSKAKQSELNVSADILSR